MIRIARGSNYRRHMKLNALILPEIEFLYVMKIQFNGKIDYK